MRTVWCNFSATDLVKSSIFYFLTHIASFDFETQFQFQITVSFLTSRHVATVQFNVPFAIVKMFEYKHGYAQTMIATKFCTKHCI